MDRMPGSVSVMDGPVPKDCTAVAGFRGLGIALACVRLQCHRAPLRRIGPFLDRLGASNPHLRYETVRDGSRGAALRRPALK